MFFFSCSTMLLSFTPTLLIASSLVLVLTHFFRHIITCHTLSAFWTALRAAPVRHSQRSSLLQRTRNPGIVQLLPDIFTPAHRAGFCVASRNSARCIAHQDERFPPDPTKSEHKRTSHLQHSSLTMQNTVTDKSNQKLSENRQAKGGNYTSDHGVSPTASLEPCEHCGEEYCTDATVGTAQVARKGSPSTVVISHSTPSTPAKRLRKKRKHDSLVSKAKEQAGGFVVFAFSEHILAYSETVPDARPTHPPISHVMATRPDEATTHAPEKELATTGARYEMPRQLQLQIPDEEIVARDFAPPHLGHASPSASPSSSGLDMRSAERRRLDELHKGVKIIYKNESARKSSSRLSFFKRG